MDIKLTRKEVIFALTVLITILYFKALPSEPKALSFSEMSNPAKVAQYKRDMCKYLKHEAESGDLSMMQTITLKSSCGSAS